MITEHSSDVSNSKEAAIYSDVQFVQTVSAQINRALGKLMDDNNLPSIVFYSFSHLSVRIMDGFVEVRRFISNNSLLFEHISNVELETEE